MDSVLAVLHSDSAPICEKPIVICLPPEPEPEPLPLLADCPPPQPAATIIMAAAKSNAMIFFMFSSPLLFVLPSVHYCGLCPEPAFPLVHLDSPGVIPFPVSGVPSRCFCSRAQKSLKTILFITKNQTIIEPALPPTVTLLTSKLQNHFVLLLLQYTFTPQLSIRFLFFVFVCVCFIPICYHVHEHQHTSTDATSRHFVFALETAEKFFRTPPCQKNNCARAGFPFPHDETIFLSSIYGPH